jgi:predicted Zn finger-like uncharacterized protein
MILTCPDCATRYFVDEGKLGPQGRKVRCTACGNAWRAEVESDPLDLTPAPVFAPVPDAPAAARPAEDLPKTFRAQQEARRRTRQAMAAGAVWACLAAGFVVVMLAAVVFRVQVVRLWPRTAGAYAALRLPVNPLGLSPEGVQATPGLQGGHAMLFVRGLERNVEATSRAPAPLRVSLYDKAGARLASQVVRLDGEPLKPGEARPFQAGFADPPLAGAQVGVDFVFERPPASPARAHRPGRIAMVAAEPRLRGAAQPTAPPPTPARLAQPLPADSPYALPPAASGQAGGAQPNG